MPAFDLVIRGGTVVDGTGSAPREADVALVGNRIAAVGAIAASGAEEIDAKGKLVTPGFVDIHTHYDAQAAGTATWPLPPGMASPPPSWAIAASVLPPASPPTANA